MAFIVVPRLRTGDTDADDYMLSGGNLCELLGVNRHKVFRTLKDVASSPVPQRWLVRNIVPHGASLGMLFGKSGSTKSYLAISLMLTVATGRPDWFGHKAKSGKVLYLCGEGHHAAYERMRGGPYCQIPGVQGLDDHSQGIELLQGLGVQVTSERTASCKC